VLRAFASVAAAVAALLASPLPATARAGGSITPVPAADRSDGGGDDALVGPVFAGEHAAVTQRVGGRVEVWGVGDGRRRVLGRAPEARGELGLVASDRFWAVSSYATGGDCAHSINCHVALDRLDAGPLGGVRDFTVGCTDAGPRCGQFHECRHVGLDADGDVLAHSGQPDGPCGGSTVRDRSNPGNAIAFDATTLRVAGRYVAWSDRESIHVFDRTARAEVYSVPADTLYDFDVQADGTIVYVDVHQLRPVAWAAVGDPRPHYLPSHRASTRMRMRDGRVATAIGVDVDGTRQGAEILVTDTADRNLARLREPYAVGGWDFDGARLTWRTQPCTSGLVSIWDLRGRPPAAPGRCPIGRIATGPRRLYGSGLGFDLPVSCRETLGCAATLRLTAAPRGRSRPVQSLGGVRYRLHTGRSRRLRVELSERASRFVARHRRVTVTAAARGIERVDGTRAASRRARFELRP
jgi:hypothetical protein